MKRSYLVLLMLLLVLPLSARTLFMDQAGLLDEADSDVVQQSLMSLSNREGMDVVVVTTNSYGGKDSRSYADDFFDYNGYGRGVDRDGILLVHNPVAREYYFSTSGHAIEAFNDDAIDYLEEGITPFLRSGDYKGAYLKFASLAENVMEIYYSGEAFRREEGPGGFFFPAWLLVSLVLGCVSGWFYVSTLKRRHRNVSSRSDADDYLKKNSMDIVRDEEIFLYRTVSRVYRPRNNNGTSSTHVSSSGRTHGGGGGRY